MEIGSSSATGLSLSSGGSSFTFDLVSTEVDCLKTSRELREQLTQYNLDESLQFYKFRITGSFQGQSGSEYEELLKDFFTSSQVLSVLQAHGEPRIPLSMKMQPLSLAVMTMDFFDRLEENSIVGPGGKIRGCFDDTFDGITVGDLLREMLLNENSENSSVYTDTEKTELIYQIFKIFAVGGSLCQPDIDIEKYLTITKAFYKELITVYKDSKTETIKVSGRAYAVEEVPGLDLFQSLPESPHHKMIVIVDPVKKFVSVVRLAFKNFW